MNGHGKGSLIWFLTVMAITALMGSVSWISLNGLIANNKAIEKQHLILESLQGVLIAVTDIETASRGYLIAQDETHLVPYNVGVQDWKIHISELSKLTLSNGEQAKRLVELENLILIKIEIVDEIIESTRSGNTSYATKIIKSGASKIAMDNFRNALFIMKNDAKTKLKHDTSAAENSARTTLLLVVMGIFLYASVSTLIPMIKKKS